MRLQQSRRQRQREPAERTIQKPLSVSSSHMLQSPELITVTKRQRGGFLSEHRTEQRSIRQRMGVEHPWSRLPHGSSHESRRQADLGDQSCPVEYGPLTQTLKHAIVRCHHERRFLRKTASYYAPQSLTFVWAFVGRPQLMSDFCGVLRTNTLDCGRWTRAEPTQDTFSFPSRAGVPRVSGNPASSRPCYAEM